MIFLDNYSSWKVWRACPWIDGKSIFLDAFNSSALRIGAVSLKVYVILIRDLSEILLNF